jgi:galactokinase
LIPFGRRQAHIVRRSIDKRPKGGCGDRVSHRPLGSFDVPIEDQLAAGKRCFMSSFNRSPLWASCAPGRVNLIGEHTDYNEGFVLPMAIAHRALVLASPTDAPRSRVLAIDLDEAIEVDFTTLKGPHETRSANYVLGVVSEFALRFGRVPNLDIVVTSTVPIGAGLSSSAAIEVAMGAVLEQVLDARLPPLDLARLCQRAEHAFPGTPCGIMDMYVATMAQPGHALLIDCRSLESEMVPLPSADEVSLLIMDTGIRHDLTDGAYADRRATCASAARRLGVTSLRDATLESIAKGALTALERRRATHVVEENARTLQAAAALSARDIHRFGRLMFESHASLRDLFEVSCPELDTLVEEARRIHAEDAGIFGARMTGGGFGGCAITMCRSSDVESVAHRLSQGYEHAHGRAIECLVARAGGGVERPAITVAGTE